MFGICQDVTERKRAEETIVRRAHELAAVYQASQHLLKLHTPDELAQEIVRVLEEVLGYEYGAVLLLDEATGQLMPFTLSDQGRGPEFVAEDKAYVAAQGVRLGLGVTGWVAQTGQSARIGDVTRDPRYFAVRHDIRSELCVPLRAGDKIIGAVNVETTRPDAYTEADQRVLETVAAQIAVAIQNARLFDEVRRGQEQVRALSARLVESEENERRELARELHDRVGQSLTALGINLTLLSQQAGREPAEKLMARLDASQEMVAEVADRIRDVMAELHPPVLDDYGLAAALRWHAERLNLSTDLKVEVTGEALSPRLPPAMALTLFRIAQEALTNVVKHAGVRQAAVSLEGLPGAARLTIADAGAGFDPAAPAAEAGAHWGLLIMRERAEALGGRLSVQSAPGQGTRIVVEMPR